MNKAIFLDRDGVINVERGDYTWKLEDFKLTSGFISFVKEVRARGYLVIIISNQGGIGRHLFTHEDTQKCHAFVESELAREGLSIDDFYYCPHHPKYTKCLCRKPEPLLLEKAIARYKIDATKSYFVGDTQRDIDAGERAGVNTIKVIANDDLCNYLWMIK
jgi:D-glycero-D-manno-heptose 1,7-bisphosphate phosphatase